MTTRQLALLAGAILAAVLVFVGLSHREDKPIALAVAHERTAVAERVVTRTDTVYKKAAAHAAKLDTIYMTVRDSARNNLGDTALVIRALDRGDSVMSAGEDVRAKADSTIAARDTLVASVRAELAVALRPASRLSGSASALYDPLTQTPAASGELSFRLTSRVSATVVYVQRFAPGERPRLYLGGKVAF